MGEKETMSGEALRESPTKASTGATTVGGLVPGGAILSAAVSSVGQLGGGKGGAASAAYAKLDAAGAEVATGDLDGDGTAESAINNSHSNIKNL